MSTHTDLHDYLFFFPEPRSAKPLIEYNNQENIFFSHKFCIDECPSCTHICSTATSPRKQFSCSSY